MHRDFERGIDPDGLGSGVAGPGPGGAGVGALAFHGGIKAVLVDAHGPVAQGVLGQIERKSECVIQLEGKVDRSVASMTWYYPQRFGDNAVRVRQIDADNEKWHWSDWQWLRNDTHSEPFSLIEVFTQQPVSAVIKTYIVLGFEHILPRGLDHILFILGIFLLSIHLRPLLWQVTMFTVAHTLTLGLSMAGLVSLPANIVEPLIALSIAYIGIENITAHSLHKSRLVIVFCFGL